MIKKPIPVDTSLYAESLNDPQVKYGLPQDISFCSSCVISNQADIASAPGRPIPGERRRKALGQACIGDSINIKL